MKYYEVNLSGNHLINFLFVHQDTLIGVAITMAILFFFLSFGLYRNENLGLGTVFLLLFLINLLGPIAIAVGISNSDPINNSYYTSPNQVTPWTKNSVYLYKVEFANEEIPNTAPKLITRTTDKIKANSATGSAYLRVTQYLVDHQTELNNVKINVSMDKTEASFDSIDGHQKIVSYANGSKKQATASTVKVLKWQK